MVKKTFASICICLLAFLVTGCGISVFEGSRLGNDSMLVMEYTWFDTIEEQELVLAEGDVVCIDVASESGNVAVSLRKGEEEPIYEEKEIPTSTVKVDITDSGTYTVTVIGQRAKGSISITKEE